MRGVTTVVFVSFLISLVRPGEVPDQKESSPATGSLQGIVVYRSGEVVRGAGVRLSPSGGRIPQRTNKKGAFVFNALPPGTYIVEVRYRQIEEVHRAGTEVKVISGQTVKVRVALARSPVLRVRVLGKRRNAIPSKVTVGYKTTNGRHNGVTRTLAPEERLYVASIPPSKEVYVKASSPGYMSSERRYSGRQLPLREVTIVLGEAYLMGKVVSKGSPIAEARVRFSPSDPSASGWGTYRRLETDSHGRFFLPPCPLGRYWFAVNAGNQGGVFREYDLTKVDEAGLTVEVEPDNIIVGRVVDSRGRPLSLVNLAVRAERRQVRWWSEDSVFTDENGSFAVGGLPATKLRVRVPRPERGYFSHGPWRGDALGEVTGIQKGKRNLVMQLSSAPALWVRTVIKTPGGTATARLWEVRSKRFSRRVLQTPVVSAGREFFLGLHPPAQYILTLWGKDVPLVVSEPFELKPEMEPLRLQVPAGVPVRGRVVSRWPLSENMKVRISTAVPGVANGKAIMSTVANEIGTFLFPRISPGRYWLSCFAEGRAWGAELNVTTAPPREVILRVGE